METRHLFPLYSCLPTCSCQQYKSFDLCHGNARMGSLSAVVEQQSILYRSQQYKCT